MAELPKKLEEKLRKRRLDDALRVLPQPQSLIDFSSNDYLGLAGNKKVADNAARLLKERRLTSNGASGSRLLTGNHILYRELEDFLTDFHNTEAALVFNSGYDANMGFFSSVPQRGDFIFYDELVHASIRDGIRLGDAKSYKFRHNDIDDLGRFTERNQNMDNDTEVYIVTESVFSMDGDSPDLKAFASFCAKNGFHLVVDEAHAIGVFGKGLVDRMQLSGSVFARIITFGKAMGCHGAAVLGSKALKDYLLNFARSLIYTTALSPHTLATILESYGFFQEQGREIQERLIDIIAFFKEEVDRLGLEDHFIKSDSAIHCMLLPGNRNVKGLSQKLHQEGFDVKPILSPTVKIGKERLRFCLHEYNSKEEIVRVLSLIKDEVK